ncbi:MAG: 4'-phosphopantetheinyl transferase superfamily protein [Myxococcota bacterium]|nr:4'-phosphopantetheinyl transferase superfamily protein [Myxococcota bacterium]
MASTHQVLGIGVDIADPERLSRVRKKGDVMRQVMGPNEAHFWPLSDADAARIWATKEAIAKSLGTGFWQHGMAWTDICLNPDWTVDLFGAAAELAESSDFRIEARYEGRYLIVTCLRTKPNLDLDLSRGRIESLGGHG